MAEEDFLKEIDDQDNPNFDTDEEQFQDEDLEDEEPEDYFIDDDEEL